MSTSQQIQQEQTLVTPTSPKRPLFGYMLSLLSHFCLTTTNYFIKRSQKNMPLAQAQFYCFLQVGVFAYFIASYQKAPLHFSVPKINKLLILRGLMGVTNTYLTYYTITLIPMSEATVIGTINPVITAIICALFLNEKFERVIIVNGITGIIGVTLIAKPQIIFGVAAGSGAEAENRFLGVCICIFSAFYFSAIQIAVKKLGPIPSISIAHWFGLITMLFTAWLMVFQGAKAMDWNDIINILMTGIPATIGYITQAIAFRHAEAGKIALIGYIGIIYALLFEILVDGRMPDYYSVLGTMSIFVGFFVLAYKTINKPKPESVKSITAK